MANIMHSRKNIKFKGFNGVSGNIRVFHSDTSISDPKELDKVIESFGRHEEDLIYKADMFSTNVYKITLYSKTYNRFISFTCEDNTDCVNYKMDQYDREEILEFFKTLYAKLYMVYKNNHRGEM